MKKSVVCIFLALVFGATVFVAVNTLVQPITHDEVEREQLVGYDVEVLGEHQMFYLEQNMLSEEFQAYLELANEVDAYILAVINQMILDDYDLYVIGEKVSYLTEKYLWPILPGMMDEHIHPFTMGLYPFAAPPVTPST